MEKLIFKGFNYSGCYGINLLFKWKNFYVMDNHGAALWTWLQHVNTKNYYQFIHIDKHYDTLDSKLQIWVNSLPQNIRDLSIEDFYNIKYNSDNEEIQTIRYDNYIPIFNSIYGNLISEYVFYTHCEGNTGIQSLNAAQEFPIKTIFENIDYQIKENKVKTILNLDIDFFFASRNNKYFQLFSDESIEMLFAQIRNCLLKSKKIEVMSVALSPECCGGWPNSLKIYNKLAQQLKLDPIEIHRKRIIEE